MVFRPSKPRASVGYYAALAEHAIGGTTSKRCPRASCNITRGTANLVATRKLPSGARKASLDNWTPHPNPKLRKPNRMYLLLPRSPLHPLQRVGGCFCFCDVRRVLETGARGSRCVLCNRLCSGGESARGSRLRRRNIGSGAGEFSVRCAGRGFCGSRGTREG